MPSSTEIIRSGHPENTQPSRNMSRYLCPGFVLGSGEKEKEEGEGRSRSSVWLA
jgi:hypothetical protein